MTIPTKRPPGRPIAANRNEKVQRVLFMAGAGADQGQIAADMHLSRRQIIRLFKLGVAGIGVPCCKTCAQPLNKTAQDAPGHD